MPQQNHDIDPFEQYRIPVKEDEADYPSLRVSELAYLKESKDSIEGLALAITKLIAKYDLDDRKAYLILNSATNAHFFESRLEKILTREEKDIKEYLYEQEVASWPSINPDISATVLDQLKATYGNPHIWHWADDVDQEAIRGEVNAAWDDLFVLTCDIWDGAHDEWADTSDVSGVDLSMKHDLFTSCPRASYQEAMRWVAHRPENEGPARDFIYLMMGVFELSWVDFLKHRKQIDPEFYERERNPVEQDKVNSEY